MPQVVVQTKFFSYRQNNSWGYFKSPAIHIIIEALDPKDADNRAEELGAYFGGSGDCPCCGDRWYPTHKTEADDEPLVYGDTPQEYMTRKTFKWGRDKYPEILVRYINGREVRYWNDGRIEDTFEGQFSEIKMLPSP
jgi:hypothetical protein